jgi:hypothetical protein
MYNACWARQLNHSVFLANAGIQDDKLPEGVNDLIEVFEIYRRNCPLRGIFFFLDPRIREEIEGVELFPDTTEPSLG